MKGRWLVLSGAIVVVGVLVWWFVRDPNPPVARGGAGPNFPARGDLVDDQELLEEAASVWREERDELDEPVRALWAGRTPQGRTVVLQSRGAFAVVQFGRGEPALGRAELIGDRFVVTEAGVLVADGLPERWRAATSGDGGLAGVAALDANEGLVQASVDENLLGLLPIREPRRGAVPVLLGGGGIERAIEVDPRDWPRFRDAMTDGLLAPLTAAAMTMATGTSPDDDVPASHARVLHVGEVPGDDVGVAASASPGRSTLIGFASGDASDPSADLLGVARRGATALAARSLDRSPAGPWLVVAGSPNIRSLVLGDSVRRGNFALLERSRLRVARVRGVLASGREIRPVGP